MNREYDKEQLREALDNFLLAVPGHELASGRVALTCTLYFRNAHLPEVQEAVCKCAKEYIALIGPEAKSAISGSPARFHLAKNGKVTPPRVSTFRNAQEKGRPTPCTACFPMPPARSSTACRPRSRCISICSSIRNTSLVSLWNA